MRKRDWLTVLPLGLIYALGFALTKINEAIGFYVWAGAFAVWVVAANVLRTPNTSSTSSDEVAHPEREHAPTQELDEEVITLSG